MIGSTILFVPELPAERSGLFERIVENEEFEKIELDYLTSLDFTIITQKNNTDWNSGSTPILLRQDEDGGLVVYHISKAGLTAVLEFEGELENVDKETLDSDLAKLREFTAEHGLDNLYEYVAF